MSAHTAVPGRIEYDDAPVRLFHFRVAIGASGGEFSDGFGLGIIGIALSLATPALHLTALWTGLIGGFVRRWRGFPC